jgi:hypothetical protein
MARPREVHALGHGLPAGHGQQLLAQGLDAQAGLGRQRDAFPGSGRGRGVLLVPDVEHRHARGQLAAQAGQDVGVGRGVVGQVGAREVVQEQHRVGAFDLPPGARHADLLDLVAALAQAGGVGHMQRHAMDLDGLRDHVARGARHRAHDGQLGAGQRVEQRTLARVGLARDHHLDAFAQQGALLRALLHGGELRLQPLELPGSRRPSAGSRFPLPESRAWPPPACAGGSARRAACGSRARRRPTANARAARGGLGAGVDQVGNGLGLRQVDLAVEKGALAELARLGHAQAGQARAAGAASGSAAASRQRASSSCSTTVPPWACSSSTSSPVNEWGEGKVNRQAVVDRLAVLVPERQVGGLARLERAAAERLDQRRQPGAGHPHDADRAAPRGGGDGDDGIGGAGKHGADSFSKKGR